MSELPDNFCRTNVTYVSSLDIHTLIIRHSCQQTGWRISDVTLSKYACRLKYIISCPTHHNSTRKRFKTKIKYALTHSIAFFFFAVIHIEKTYREIHETAIAVAAPYSTVHVALFLIPVTARIRNQHKKKNLWTVQNKSCHKTFRGARDFVTTSTIAVSSFLWNMSFLCCTSTLTQRAVRHPTPHVSP